MSETATATITEIQLDLFSGFAATGDKPRVQGRRGPCRAQPLATSETFQKLMHLLDRQELTAEEEEGEDDPLVSAPIEHRWVDAAACKAPKTNAPRSIFDLGAAGVLSRAPRSRDEAKAKAPSAHIAIAREDGIVRVTRMHHTETDEWQSKERARRARQTPPRPKPQTFKMKNSRTWE